MPGPHRPGHGRASDTATIEAGLAMNRDLPNDEQAENYFTEQEVADAVAAIGAGSLVLLKGDIGYGLFGITEDALRKMYRIKGRPYSNPCIVICNLDVLEDIALIPDQKVRDWIVEQSSWTTMAVVLPVNPESTLLARLPDWVRGQTVTNGTVAAFLRPGPYLNQVVARAREQGILFVGSSANPSSHGNIYDFEEIPKEIVGAVDFYVNHGKSKHANPERKATTMVNFTNWTIKRRGVNWERIETSFLNLKEELQNA